MSTGSDRRLLALADVIAEYEAEFGVITADELAAQTRADRAAARVVEAWTSPASRRSPRASR